MHVQCSWLRVQIAQYVVRFSTGFTVWKGYWLVGMGVWNTCFWRKNKTGVNVGFYRSFLPMTNSLVRWYQTSHLGSKTTWMCLREKNWPSLKRDVFILRVKVRLIDRIWVWGCSEELLKNIIHYIETSKLLEYNTHTSNLKVNKFCANFNNSKLAYSSRQFYGKNTIKLKHLKQDPRFPKVKRNTRKCW